MTALAERLSFGPGVDRTRDVWRSARAVPCTSRRTLIHRSTFLLVGESVSWHAASMDYVQPAARALVEGVCHPAQILS